MSGINYMCSEYEDEKSCKKCVQYGDCVYRRTYPVKRPAPSDEIIDYIIDLLYEANKEIRLDVVDGIFSLKEARKKQIEYIKKHWE